MGRCILTVPFQHQKSRQPNTRSSVALGLQKYVQVLDANFRAERVGLLQI